MADYSAVIQTPMPAHAAFEYMADLRNFEAWDPGVKSAHQVTGDGPGPDAEYDLELAAMTLRYKTTEYQSPTRIVVEARSTLLSSFDTIEVTETATGSTVRYEAIVELSGPLRLLDPVFGLFFDRIGDKGAAGIAEALDGAKVS